MKQAFSLYIHIPFCKHRCAYCDFNTYAGLEETIPAYISALCEEIRMVGTSGSTPNIRTIFFGGGTPSLVEINLYENIFEQIYKYFNFEKNIEISLEANPGTVTLQYLQELKQIGFNRVSFGVQSAHPEELRLLERIHSYAEAVEAFKWARMAGFANINFDLIYGLPGQTLERWSDTLKLVTDLKPEHLSAYSLTIEPGTLFWRWAKKGLLPVPDQDLAAAEYEHAMGFLAEHGYMQYEISNWALPKYECQHNLQYWRNQPYLGFGAGAHGYANGYRYSNVLRIKTYIERMKTEMTGNFPLSSAVVNHQLNSKKDDMQETMITGLRLTEEGISRSGFEERFGIKLEEFYKKEIRQSIDAGLLEWVGDVLRLTVRGRLLGNQVFMQFVD